MRANTNAELLRRVDQVCRLRGLRWTPLRADVLDLIAVSAHPLKAYELLERIRESKAITAPPTAYRTLDFLLEHGFIHKLESINAYVACRWPEDIHTGTFMVCDRCEAATEVMDSDTENLLRSRALQTGFQLRAETRTIEIHGLCRLCAQDGA